MKIHLALPFAMHDQAIECREELKKLGHRVVSQWINRPWIDYPDGTLEFFLSREAYRSTSAIPLDPAPEYGMEKYIALARLGDAWTADVTVCHFLDEDERRLVYAEAILAMLAGRAVCFVGTNDFGRPEGVSCYASWRKFFATPSGNWLNGGRP